VRVRLRTRTLQIILVCLLTVTFAFLVYWVVDETRYTSNLHQQIAGMRSGRADAANRLLETGMSSDRVAELYPDLVWLNREKRFEPAASVKKGESSAGYPHRPRRFVLAGAFLLIALCTGMNLLVRTFRHDARRRRRQRNFLAAISHEFKTPIAGMRLAVETIALRDPPSDRRKQLIERLLGEIDRLETMVSNLLDTSLIEEGRIMCRPERVPLGRAVASVVKSMEQRARRAGVTLEAKIPADLDIKADPAALRAVIDNLVDNAIKACTGVSGGCVRIIADRSDDFARMEITDNGVGFPPGEAPRLFERFYRVTDGLTSKGGGSGLGLYIVRHLAEKNGAAVSARSEGKGKGATFTVLWRAAGEER
jgi:signal transduction histidine kinase